MLNLLQLNQHLDDTHAETNEFLSDNMMDWFKKRTRQWGLKNTFHNKSSSSIQEEPTSFSNVKERVLRRSTSNMESLQTRSPVSEAESHTTTKETLFNSKIKISRAHWQKETGYELCQVKSCAKSLGILYGKVNCHLYILTDFNIKVWSILL